eukprot:349903-Chlamydomonas_euryale.AAC.1
MGLRPASSLETSSWRRLPCGPRSSVSLASPCSRAQAGPKPREYVIAHRLSNTGRGGASASVATALTRTTARPPRRCTGGWRAAGLASAVEWPARAAALAEAPTPHTPTTATQVEAAPSAAGRATAAAAALLAGRRRRGGAAPAPGRVVATESFMPPPLSAWAVRGWPVGRGWANLLPEREPQRSGVACANGSRTLRAGIDLSLRSVRRDSVRDAVRECRGARSVPTASAPRVGVIHAGRGVESGSRAVVKQRPGWRHLRPAAPPSSLAGLSRPAAAGNVQWRLGRRRDTSRT